MLAALAGLVEVNVYRFLLLLIEIDRDGRILFGSMLWRWISNPILICFLFKRRKVVKLWFGSISHARWILAYLCQTVFFSGLSWLPAVMGWRRRHSRAFGGASGWVITSLVGGVASKVKISQNQHIWIYMFYPRVSVRETLSHSSPSRKIK